MNKRNIFVLVFVVAIVFIIGGISIGKVNKAVGYIPPLNVIGDVEEVITLWDFVVVRSVDRFTSAYNINEVLKDQSSQRWSKYVVEIEL